MRQPAAMVMNIPEFALIAEHNFEVSAENLASLRNGWIILPGSWAVSFICVLDARGSLIAKTTGRPGETTDLGDFLVKSPQGRGMIDQIFRQSTTLTPNASSDIFGMWDYQNRVYQVVGVPLMFNADDGEQLPGIDGALIMAVPMTDEIATILGKSQDCQINSWRMASRVSEPICQNIAPESLNWMTKRSRQSRWPLNYIFNVTLGDVLYRSSIDPIIDPCSDLDRGLPVDPERFEGIDDGQTESLQAAARDIIGGLVAAAIASYIVERRYYRTGAGIISRRAAACRVRSRHQRESGRQRRTGALATAFNDMVRQLRTRREL